MERKTSVSMKDVNEAIARASTAAPPPEEAAEPTYSPSVVKREGSISRREVVRAGSRLA